MPTADYNCPRCRQGFTRIVFKGEAKAPAACPRCGEPQVKPLPGPASLFDGFSPFSRMNADTN